MEGRIDRLIREVAGPIKCADLIRTRVLPERHGNHGEWHTPRAAAVLLPERGYSTDAINARMPAEIDRVIATAVRRLVHCAR